MSLEQLSHFRIVTKIGEGGMGEVYRATDERLGREVAIKILPAAVTDDPERLARLEREARILASLNHPNIAGLHDIGQAEGVHYLVMELASGEGLDARIARGAMPLDEALPLAIQITRALEAAHERGIVHRDLKPANVMVDESGNVKLLDFGLAKAIEADPTTTSGTSLAHSPTLTARATAAGMILGTASYMAPEQARGREVDKRTDVWAFGVLLYEMLTGRRLFDGETISDILAAVLRADIDWDALPAHTPRALRNLLRRSIVRDPDSRLRDIGDVRIVLEEVAAGDLDDEPARSEATDATTPSRAGGRPAVAWIGGAFAAGAIALWAVLQLVGPSSTETSSTAAPPTLAFRQLTLLPGGESQGAISPDGESFLFVKTVGDQTDVFLQRVDGQNAINLTESCTEDDYGAEFSPDGRRIAFRSECGGGGVFVMGAMGESVRKVTDDGYAPSWSPDGSRLVVADEHPTSPLARNIRSRLWVVEIDTGERTRITERDAVGPAWSPDGRWIAFWGLPLETSFRDIYLVAADGSTSGPDDAVQLTDDAFIDWNPIWSPDSRWLYFSSTRGGTFNVWRLEIDPETGRRVGEPQPLTAPSSHVGELSMSKDGQRMVFTDSNVRQRTWLARVDPRTGGDLANPVEVPMGSMTLGGYPEPSPDGQSVLSTTPGYPQHLIMVGADGSGLRRLTDGLYRDRQGAWSPDGEWIAFQTDRFPDSRIGLIRADGSGLRSAGGPSFASWFPRWSPDGETIVVSSNDGPHVIEPWAGDPSATIEPLPLPGDGLNFWVTAYSSDGTRIAGVIYRGAVPESAAVLSLDTGRYEILGDLTGETSTRFLPGDRSVVWSDDDGLIVYDLTTGTSRSAIEATPGYGIDSFSLPASGNWLSWIEAADESDIWLADFR